MGGDRVGIKLSPFHSYGNIVIDHPVETYQYLIEELNKLDFAYVELMKRNPYFSSPAHYPAEDEVALFGRSIRQVVIANTGYQKASAELELEKGHRSTYFFRNTVSGQPRPAKAI